MRSDTGAEIGGPCGDLAKLEPFGGHSMSAEWQDDDTNVIYSQT